MRPQSVNSHHRLLVGHLPHYYVPKSRGYRLAWQNRPISMDVSAVRSVLAYSVVEDLATGGACVELTEMTTAEQRPDSIAWDLTIAWLEGKAEPRLFPQGVPETLWVEKEAIEDDEDLQGSVEFVCKSLSVNLREYSDAEHIYGLWNRGFRKREEIEAHIERVFDHVGVLRGHNYDFDEYRLPLAHACGRWLGTHRQMFEAMDGFGTPGEVEGALSTATRVLPDAWFKVFQTIATRDEWKNYRPLYFAPSTT